MCYPMLSGWAWYYHKIPYKRVAEGWRVRGSQGHVCLERDQSFENWGRGHRPKNAGATRSWESQGSRFSPEAPRRDQPCHHLDFSPIILISDFWLHHRKIIHLSWLNPLSLWWLVTAARGIHPSPALLSFSAVSTPLSPVFSSTVPSSCSAFSLPTPSHSPFPSTCPTPLSLPPIPLPSPPQIFSISKLGSNPGCTACWLCDREQVPLLLWITVFSSGVNANSLTRCGELEEMEVVHGGHLIDVYFAACPLLPCNPRVCLIWGQG